MEEVVGRERVAVEMVSRVQMRAIVSGLAVGVGVFALCMGFSWAVGLSTFQPTAGHARGLALGNSIWGAIALWIAMFFSAYIAAIASRSIDRRSGVLHGLVVWGASAGLLGFAIMVIFSRLLGSIAEMGGESGGVQLTANTLMRMTHAAGLTLWLYWAGIVGGLITSIAGGVLGVRSESTEPRRVRETKFTGSGVPQPGAPQPAY